MAGDPQRLRQVLVNLVGNAIKFTDAGEVCVRVWCEVHGGNTSSDDACTLHIDVRDTGIGMSPRQIDRLFQPFTQADETTTRRFGGSGLGLAISQRLVMLLGGTLTVVSEEGIGSAFSVSLPVRIPQPAEQEGSQDAQPLLYGQTGEPVDLRGRILVAEDMVDTQRLLSIVLGSAGAEIDIVGDGQDAIDLAMEHSFDLILMDMQMPRLDGYAAASELRRRGCTVPIVALTGHALGGDREKCLAAGCSDYLSKPIDVPVLLATLARHLTPADTQHRALVEVA
jgi:CheY-like chemotaxis protein